MTRGNAPTRGRQTFVEVARGPVAIGLPVGSAIGAVVGGLTRDNLAGGFAVGSILALLVVAFLVAHDLHTGAMGVPHRQPFRPGDRFLGWTVAGRLHTGYDRTVEYEVRHGDDRGLLTVLPLADRDPARPARRLPHPLEGIQSRHLSQPMDIGRAGRHDYVITELERSESLAAHVARVGRLVEVELFRVAIGTALALKDIHARNTAHGRVTPDQITVSDTRVALNAFDPLARCRGTEVYSAPEQTLGDELGTEAADVFSWASTVYFAATGHPPFTTHGQSALGPSAGEPDLTGCPEWLRPVLATALADDPAARPDAAAAVESLRVVGREFGWQLTRPEPLLSPAKPLPRTAVRAMVVVLASVVLTAAVPLLVPANGVDAAEQPPPVPTTTTPVVTTTGDVTTTTSTTSTETTTRASTTSTSTGTGWPVDANDGSSAFWAYLGASFILPDWVACDSGFCIVGSGDTVYLFTDGPIEDKGQVALAVPDPAAALTGLGLTPEQASGLLAR